MRKNTDEVPRWQREDDSIDFAQAEGTEQYGSDDQLDVGESTTDGHAASYMKKKRQATLQEMDAAPPAAAAQKKDYPTTEHAIRTLALHTGIPSSSWPPLALAVMLTHDRRRNRAGLHPGLWGGVGGQGPVNLSSGADGGSRERPHAPRGPVRRGGCMAAPSSTVWRCVVDAS